MHWLVAFISDTALRLYEALGLLRIGLMIESKPPFVRIRQHNWRHLKTAASEFKVLLVGAFLWVAQRVLAADPDSQISSPRYNKKMAITLTQPVQL